MIAGNTTQTMKPKEVNVVVPVQSSDVNKPEIDQAAPILPEPVNEAFELPENWPREEDTILPVNNWVLRNRIEKCEEQIDSILNRLALFNIRSGQKI